MAINYAAKFDSFRGRTLYERLSGEDRECLRNLAFTHRLTFPEFRQVAEAARDLSMWGVGDLRGWYGARRPRGGKSGIGDKERLLAELWAHLDRLRNGPVDYGTASPKAPVERERKRTVTENSDKTPFGMCPVASEKTVCCNLRTIDAVENCVFGCSYCSVQTFYRDDIVFDRDLAGKLAAIRLESGRFYHIGTGQASDALAWGNRAGILDALCEFAAGHPGILLELKTKSDNVRYFLDHRAPRNVVCSWSLNTPAVIANEEHFTAGLEGRLQAARAVADRGVRVAFHFHPMVHYEGWDRDYPEVAGMLMERFSPEEVAFISFGSVTLIKPVIRKIRQLGNPTRMLQARFVPDPHGKMTYSDDVKIDLFRSMYEAFSPWQRRVFIYLCMEKAHIWEKAFGRAYESNEAFEADFGLETMGKLPA
ncbi:MAG: radical SAM protein [Candidatus Krumholzibacteriia bacterium]